MQEETRKFSARLEEKRDLIDGQISLGRQFQLQFMQQTSSTDVSNNAFSDTASESDGAATNSLVSTEADSKSDEGVKTSKRRIRLETNRLVEKWADLQNHSDIWTRKLDDILPVR